MAVENKKGNLQNLPICAVDFINKVIKKMRYRSKVRRDVQAELIAHFEDALKDCDTDKKREEKAGRLITEFGDVKLLAILLRRAKKRCRPLWRTIAARSFQMLGILILSFIVVSSKNLCIVFCSWFVGTENIFDESLSCWDILL